MTIAAPTAHRWTRAEFRQMNEANLFLDRRVELIDGEVMDMPALGNPHGVSLECTREVVATAFGPGPWLRSQMALDLGTFSEPQPDLAVVPGKPRDYADHPKTALLVIEISDRSRSYDRNKKASLYAQAGIAEYWIINLEDRQLEVHRGPVADDTHPFGFRYGARQVLREGDSVRPVGAPSRAVAVSDLLP